MGWGEEMSLFQCGGLDEPPVLFEVHSAGPLRAKEFCRITDREIWGQDDEQKVRSVEF